MGVWRVPVLAGSYFVFFFSENSKFVSISLFSSLGGGFQTLVFAKDEGTVSSDE